MGKRNSWEFVEVLLKAIVFRNVGLVRFFEFKLSKVRILEKFLYIYKLSSLFLNYLLFE